MKLLIAILFLSTVAVAKGKEKHEHREHGAHEHGAGTLGIAFDGVKGKMDLKIPSESIMGFEYTPKTDKDKKIKADALAKLESKIAEMVVFDASLGCVITKDKIEVVKDEKESKEAHSEHSDTVANYNVACAKSPVGSEVTFNFQKHFSRIKDLDVQVIVDNVQKSIEAKANTTKLLLK